MAYKHFFNSSTRFILILLLIIQSQIILAQTKKSDFSWRITARSAGNSSGFDIEINQQNSKTNFVFKRVDSIRLSEMEKDPAYIQQRAAVKAAVYVNDATYEAEKLGLIVERFSVYQTDTLYYPEKFPDSVLVSFLDSIHSVAQESLKVTIPRIQNSRSNLLSFHFTRINGKKKTVDMYATNPTADSHPLLYRLVIQTLSFYRKERPAALITTDFTKSY